MILRTPPPRKRRAESQLPEDVNDGCNDNNNDDRNDSNIDVIRVNPSSNSKQILIYEDLPAPEHSHEHVTSEQMLCTYQCRQMVKSEFFDALSSAEKVAHDYRSKFEVLNDHFAKAESERVKFRDKLLNTEQELAAAKGREQMLQEQLRKEIEFSHEQLRKQIQSFSELELKFRNEADLRKKAESSAAKAEEKANISQEKLNTLSESIDREKKRLQNELVQMKSESKLSLSRISADLEKMECRAKNAETESSFLKAQLEDLKKRLDECMQEKFEVEKELSKRSTEAPPKDTDVLIKHLQEELRNCASEVRAARKLKASHEDMELLKEKLYEEKRRREKAELDLLKVSELQLSVHKLENELSAWKSVIKEIPGVSSADDVPLRFAALQKESVDSMMKASEAQVRVKEIEVTLDAALLGKKNAESEAVLAQKKAQSYQIEKERLESMLALIKGERDHLKDFITEFQHRKGLEGGTESGSSVVQELEASLSRKESYVRELESSLLEQKDINSRQQNEINLLNERLTSEARRIKMLEREDDRLRSEIALLESKLGHGDFSSANTKVLRMVNTLAVDNEAKQTIEALQNELQKTKEKLQAIEELNKQSCNIADAGTVDSFVAGKLKQLKEQIATLEKREERYRTVFAERISVFRRACCELFGYKIVMDDHQRADGIPVTRFTLHSIYAMSDDEKLQFEYESGNTNIVMNEYASQNEISRQIEIFIRKMNSIPAFTANLTVESFNKRTLS